MNRPTSNELDLSPRAWPVHLPPAGFAEAVLERATRVGPGESRSVVRVVSLRKRWSLAIAAALVGIGATAAAYKLVTSDTQPALTDPVASIAAPRFVPAPLVPAINSAVSEPERALTVARRAPTVSAASVSVELSTAAEPTAVPHYPPCHCGPGGVVCSCFE